MSDFNINHEDYILNLDGSTVHKILLERYNQHMDDYGCPPKYFFLNKAAYMALFVFLKNIAGGAPGMTYLNKFGDTGFIVIFPGDLPAKPGDIAPNNFYQKSNPNG